jgi:DNA-binding PadR family transcriptional regulator
MRDRDVRLTQPALKVLRVLLGNSGRLSGAEIAKVTHATSGTLYPLLARLEANGWAASAWEEVDPRDVGRPRRRFYNLTALGRAKAHEALADLQVQMGVGGLAWNA